jgi:hypothetical protein
VKGIAVSNPLSLIAVFASLAESIALAILPFAEHLSSAQKWAIILFTVLYPLLMAGTFWWVLIYRHANLFSPEEHGREHYPDNVLKYNNDRDTNGFFDIWSEADRNGRCAELNDKITEFMGHYGLEDDSISFMMNSSNGDLQKEVMAFLKKEWK